MLDNRKKDLFQERRFWQNILGLGIKWVLGSRCRRLNLLFLFQNFKGSNFLGGNTKTREFLCRALIIIDTAHLHSFRILGQPSLLKVPANFQMLNKIFLATLVALHFTPVSQSLGRVSTSVASRLASLLRWEQLLFWLFFRGVAREM